jgi:hypothetical protein
MHCQCTEIFNIGSEAAAVHSPAEKNTRPGAPGNDMDRGEPLRPDRHRDLARGGTLRPSRIGSTPGRSSRNSTESAGTPGSINASSADSVPVP